MKIGTDKPKKVNLLLKCTNFLVSKKMKSRFATFYGEEVTILFEREEGVSHFRVKCGNHEIPIYYTRESVQKYSL